MRVTIITPCFNPGRYLLPMLKSVEEQSDFVAKHIVMDGNSTDGTVEKLKEWAGSHPWFEFVSEKDNGQSDACQKALERVQTEYFFWLNADDFLLPGALEALLKGAYASGGGRMPSIVYGDRYLADDDGKLYGKRKRPTYSYWDCLHGYMTVANICAIFHAPRLRELGGFDPSLRFVMDYDIILKLGKEGPVKHIKHFCGAFRIHETSKTSTISDVCRRETFDLRTKYGVTTNKALRRLLEMVAKIRVGLRMLFQGCWLGRKV